MWNRIVNEMYADSADAADSSVCTDVSVGNRRCNALYLHELSCMYLQVKDKFSSETRNVCTGGRELLLSSSGFGEDAMGQW